MLLRGQVPRTGQDDDDDHGGTQLSSYLLDNCKLGAPHAETTYDLELHILVRNKV